MEYKSKSVDTLEAAQAVPASEAETVKLSLLQSLVFSAVSEVIHKELKLSDEVANKALVANEVAEMNALLANITPVVEAVSRCLESSLPLMTPELPNRAQEIRRILLRSLEQLGISIQLALVMSVELSSILDNDAASVIKDISKYQETLVMKVHDSKLNRESIIKHFADRYSVDHQ